MHRFPQTNRNLLIALCVQQQSEAQQRRTDSFLCPGGVGGVQRREGRREEGCVCVFFFSSASQLSKITQAECALQKPLPRQLERRGEERRASIFKGNTVNGGGRLHIVFAHKNTAMRNVRFLELKLF